MQAVIRVLAVIVVAGWLWLTLRLLVSQAQKRQAKRVGLQWALLQLAVMVALLGAFASVGGPVLGFLGGLLGVVLVSRFVLGVSWASGAILALFTLLMFAVLGAAMFPIATKLAG